MHYSRDAFIQVVQVYTQTIQVFTWVYWYITKCVAIVLRTDGVIISCTSYYLISCWSLITMYIRIPLCCCSRYIFFCSLLWSLLLSNCFFSKVILTSDIWLLVWLLNDNFRQYPKVGSTQCFCIFKASRIRIWWVHTRHPWENWLIQDDGQNGRKEGRQDGRHIYKRPYICCYPHRTMILVARHRFVGSMNPII